MLQNSLYEVRSFHQEPGSIKGEIALDKDHEIFKGHFPSIPVLPGVCMMQIIKELVIQAVDKPLMIRNASQLKFLRLIDPRQNPVLAFEISYTTTGDMVDVSGELKSAEHSFFKMKAALTKF